VTDACSCGYAGPQSHCHLCHTTGLTTPEMLNHLRLLHPEQWGDGPGRWPDGAPVVVDTTLQPEDFR
jgi:hypothetical protein